MKDVTDLVSSFGGRETVAKRFALTPKAVEQWEKRGFIPGRWHIALLVWAREIEIPLSMSDLSDGAAPGAVLAGAHA